MQIEKRGLNRPLARSAPFRGKRIWRKFHLGGFHQRASICPVWFESWQGKFAGGKQLLSKAPRLQTNQQNWSSTSVQIKNRQLTSSMYNVTHIVISHWSVGTYTSMELCLVQIAHSSPNTCHFVKTSRVCHFWPPSHHLLHFTVKIVCLFLDIEGVQVFYSQVTWLLRWLARPFGLINVSFHSKQKLQLAANTT